MATTGPEQIAEKLVPLAEAIANLRPDPRNARKHGDKNLAAVRSSLTRFGQVKPIVVDADGIVLAGNGTLEAAKALGWKRLAVVRVPLTGADARAYALADNRTAELAEWDWEELASQTRELGAEAMLDIGWRDYELAPLLQAVWTPPAVDPDYVAPQVRSPVLPADSAPSISPAQPVTPAHNANPPAPHAHGHRMVAVSQEAWALIEQEREQQSTLRGVAVSYTDALDALLGLGEGE